MHLKFSFFFFYLYFIDFFFYSLLPPPLHTHTHIYQAPEILDSKQYDAKGDLWSVGIILYECLTGSSPYKADNYLQLIAKIKSETIRMPNNISPECRDLLQNLLKVDPNERISFEDFFAHPFIQLSHYKEESKC